MIITKETKQNFIFKTRIDFVIDDNDEYVILREMNTAEQNAVLQAGKLNADGEPTDVIAMTAQAEKYFTGCIIDHSGVDEEGKKVSNQLFYDFIKQSSSIFQAIMTTWIQSKRMDLKIQKSEGGNPLA